MTNEQMALKIQAGESGLMGDLWERNIKFFKSMAYKLLTYVNYHAT